MKPDFNITIIGAGVVGLAIAAELSKSFSKIVVVEKHSKFGQETSSRNSEVIHSGIYYPKGSLKAKLCVEGKKLLYNYCETKEVTFNKCGKLIVATNTDEAKQLDDILKRSQENGVEDGRKVSQDEVKEMEPNVNAVSALYFPSTGIIDSHGLMKQLQTDSINNSVDFAYNSDVVGLKKVESEHKPPFYEVEVKEQNHTCKFTSTIVINAAGLQSDKIASLVGLNNPEYELHYWKGEYFGVGNGKNKQLRRLVYPVPYKNNTSLGIHATIDLNGGLKLGPNALYLDDHQEDYSIEASNKWGFYESVSKYLPFIEKEDLHADQAGIRPKLQKPGDPVRDFIIEEESNQGRPGFINLIGIESPGLTASLAIGKYVSKWIDIE